MRDNDERGTTRLRTHTLTLENRERIVLTGVDDVDNFNEGEINLMTGSGYISIRGSDLHISQLSIDDGHLVIEGHIDGLMYSDIASQEGGFFKRMFK